MAPMPFVATDAALSAAATTAYPNGVWRTDYALGNGAPPLFYAPSRSPCSLNSGAGDNGSEVASAEGGCWLARFPAAGASIKEWGAYCDGVYINGRNNPIINPDTGKATFAVSGVSFGSADLGKLVAVPGAGKNGAPFLSSIASASGNRFTTAEAVPNGGNVEFILAVYPTAPGTGATPGEVLTFGDGTFGNPAQATVVSTLVTAVAIDKPGSGGIPNSGPWTLYGTTGNGNRVVVSAIIGPRGGLSAVSIAHDPTGLNAGAGSYTTNPANLAAEPLASNGSGLTGATVSLTMGIRQARITNYGVYSGTVPPTFSRYTTTGRSAGARFGTIVSWNGATVLYGHNDGPALQAALNWAGANHGTLRWPEGSGPRTICMTAQSLTQTGGATTLIGHADAVENPNAGTWPGTGPIPYPSGGTILQAMAPLTTPLLDYNPAQQVANNTIDGLVLSGALPADTGTIAAPQPLATEGLQLLSNAQATLRNVIGWEFSQFDIKIGALIKGAGNLDSIHGLGRNIYTFNELPVDGIGIWSSGTAIGDTDYWRWENIGGTYSGSPCFLWQSVDDSKIGSVHCFKRPEGNSYGLDVSGDIHGCFGSCPNQPSSGIINGMLSATMIIRGKESTSGPPTRIFLTGEPDYGNNIPLPVEWFTGEDFSENLPLTQYSVTGGSVGGGGVTFNVYGSGLSAGTGYYTRHGKEVCPHLSGRVLWTGAPPTALTITLPTPAFAVGLDAFVMIDASTRTPQYGFVSGNTAPNVVTFPRNNVNSGDYFLLEPLCYVSR